MMEMSLDLSHLYRHRLFQSDAPTESHDLAAKELADHSLRWGTGVVDTKMCKAEVRQLQLFTLSYGAEVEITPRPSEDFIVVHSSLHGMAEVISDGERIVLSEGRTGWIAPRKSWYMRWQAGSEQLILKVPKRMLGSSGITQKSSALSPAGLFPNSVDRQWHSLIQVLLNASSISINSPAHENWVDHFEQVVAMFLVSQGAVHESIVGAGQFNDEDPVEVCEGLLVTGASRRLEAMESYIRGRLSAPVSLIDLARAAGVSSRVLQTLCHRHRGATPTDLLRNMRLDAVRARLLMSDASNVTEAALEFGFGHLGRFSTYYRERFGELPRETADRRK
jgi:AraC-like DNA-binding protein